MNDSALEQFPKKEWENLVLFATLVTKLPLYRDYYTVDSLRLINPTTQEIYEVAETLIQSWIEIGVEGAPEVIQKAFDPIFSDPESPDRFARTIKEYEPLWREHVPYMILSAEEFLVRAKDPLEMKRIMAGSFSHDVWYYYLHSLDQRYNNPELLAMSIQVAKEGKPNFNIDEEIERQLANQPKVASEIQEAREFIENGTYPSDERIKDLKFAMAYRKELESKIREVIGCDAIGYLMRHEKMSFEEAYNTEIDRARLIVKSGEFLKKLNRSLSHLLN